MKTVSFILFYMTIVLCVILLISITCNAILGHFEIAILHAVLLLCNMLAAAIGDAYEEPRNQMYKFIDKYLK